MHIIKLIIQQFCLFESLARRRLCYVAWGEPAKMMSLSLRVTMGVIPKHPTTSWTCHEGNFQVINLGFGAISPGPVYSFQNAFRTLIFFGQTSILRDAEHKKKPTQPMKNHENLWSPYFFRKETLFEHNKVYIYNNMEQHHFLVFFCMNIRELRRSVVKPAMLVEVGSPLSV